MTPEPVSSEGDPTGASVSHAAAAARGRVCEFYGRPGQDCVTAGPEVVAAEGLCGPCAVRYLAQRAAPDPLEKLRAVPQQILNTVDPLGPGHEVRMQCVRIVRAALSDTAAPDHDPTTSPEDQT